MVNFLRLIAFAGLLFSWTNAFALFDPPPDKWQCTNASTGSTIDGRCSACGLVQADNIGTDWNYCKDPATEMLVGQEYKVPDGACPENSSSDGAGKCQCSTNYEEAPDGKSCQRKPLNCEPGYVQQGDECVPKKCEPDEIRVNGVCVKEPECPPGEERVNGVCKKTGCEAGKDAGWRSGLSDGETAYYCVGGCQAKARASTCVTWDGKTDCGGTARLTGARCTGNEGGDTDTPPDDDDDNDDDDEDNDPDEPEEPGDGPGNGGGGDGPGTGGEGDGPGGGNPGDPDGPDDPDEPDEPGDPGGENPMEPPNEPLDPDEDGKCPEGYHRQGRFCIQDPVDPDDDGACPPGFVRINARCYATYPSDGDGDGDDDGDGEKGSFGGSCDSGFTCKGDAIQCAIAYEQHRRACQLYVLKTAESELYYKERGKTGNRTLTLEGNETIDINSRIDSTDVLGGGAGAQDYTFTIHGQQITIPFSALNPYLAAFGDILVAIAFLIAMRIIGKG